MNSERKIEIFLFEDTFFLNTQVPLKKVEGDRVVTGTTQLFKKFAVLGKKVYIKYSTFVLPAKIAGKADNEIILTLPSLSPEKPVGDRKSARVKPSHIHPVKLYIKEEGREVEHEVEDISEGGFSIIVGSHLEVDRFLGKEVSVHIDFPVEAEEVKGKARLVNIQELPDGRVKLGFELLVDDADMVKIRFYVYSRIKEILRG